MHDILSEENIHYVSFNHFVETRDFEYFTLHRHRHFMPHGYMGQNKVFT